MDFVPSFDELKTSTKTVMVYSNVVFDFSKIFLGMYVTPVDVPLTKKKKNVDKKKLVAPYGSIISIQKGTFYRGVDLRKRRKHWCASNCRPIIQRENKTIYKDTVCEERAKIPNTDIYKIKYFCTSCEKYYSHSQLKKIPTFLNQVTFVLSIGHVNLNIMMFKDNFKIVGCKSNKDAYEATMILWNDYIKPVSDCWKMKTEEEHPNFVFKLVMKNMDFRLGFFIDRNKLSTLMNSPEFKDKVFLSQRETTGHTNVNIKMYTKKPENYHYLCLVFPSEGEEYFLRLEKNPYKPIKKKKKKFTTFIVFSSSETILSGRYTESMRESYNFFVDTVIKNKKEIEENIVKPELSLLEYLEHLEI